MIAKHINIMNMMMMIISRIRLSSGDRPPGEGEGAVQLFQFKQFCLLWIRYHDVGDGGDDGAGDDHDHHDEETSRKREVQLIKF